jgi:outer membrane receptor protein involved in Fe transport
MRRLKAAAVRAALSTFCCFILLTTAYARADEPDARPFDISPQSLATALSEFARQSQQEILFAPEVVAQKLSSGVRGTMQPLAALKLLLKDSALTFTTTAKGAVLVGAPPSGGTTSLSSGEETGAPKPAAEDGVKDAHTAHGAERTSIDHRLRVAQEETRSDSSVGRQGEQGSKIKIAQLEEVVVTAQKRSEKLIDVPSSISVLSGDLLESLQSNSLPDFAGYVPGLTVAGGGSPGQNMLVIRGLSTGIAITTGSLVATYIDDLPVGSTTGSVRGSLYGLDLMPYDIERIEVLRGPQGTLYGADAMGGLIKYSLRKPDLTQFDARVGADEEHVNGAGNLTWGGRGSVNLPVITDTLGIRLSGFYKDNAGYIDNVGTGTRDANHSTESGGRAAVLWKPADNLSVQATILAQDIDSADQTVVTLNGSTLQPVYGPQARFSLFPEPFKQQMRDYSLSIEWDLHFATLTNSSSWSRLNSRTGFDLTHYFASFIPPPGGLADYLITDTVSKLTEEMRLVSAHNQRIQWLLGGFYTKEDTESTDTTPTFTPTYVPLPTADNVLFDVIKKPYKERAIFGNATYQIADHFDIGGGARYAQNTETNCTPVAGGLLGLKPVPCASRPYVGVATWMADARFHLDQNSMFYLRWATGYRPGGCPLGCVADSALKVPATFGPDKIANYEVGFKGEFFDHRLQLDLSAFHIDWRDMQSQVVSSIGIDYTGNGGTATSNGFELTTSYQVTEFLLLKATLDDTDAHLTEDAPGILGKNGDQLPASPRWSGSLFAEYRQPLSERRQFLLGAGYRYKDAVVNQFAGTGNPLPVGPQNVVDLYTGFVMNQVSARLYAKNVFNNRSYMGLEGIYEPEGPMFVPVQPRTIGLSLDYRF